MMDRRGPGAQEARVIGSGTRGVVARPEAVDAGGCGIAGLFAGLPAATAVEEDMRFRCRSCDGA
jgi:hypothetical protein